MYGFGNMGSNSNACTGIGSFFQNATELIFLVSLLDFLLCKRVIFPFPFSKGSSESCRYMIIHHLSHCSTSISCRCIHDGASLLYGLVENPNSG